MTRARVRWLVALGAAGVLACAAMHRTEPEVHGAELAGAPENAHALANPLAGDPNALVAGAKLFARDCAHCHGADRRGAGRAPALDPAVLAGFPEGDIFWFLTNGNLWAGMPSWSRLPAAQRWQLVTYLQSGRSRHR